MEDCYLKGYREWIYLWWNNKTGVEKRTEKPNENRSITMFAHASAHLNGSQPNGFLDEWPNVSQNLFINL